jgi:integrase
MKSASVDHITPLCRALPDLPGSATSDDFARWEHQLATTGNCANPVRLRGRIDAIGRATGEKASIYDTASEPGGVLRIPCGSRREHICPACSEVYKGDARQIIRSGLTGGKGIPESVATHPCVFATLTACEKLSKVQQDARSGIPVPDKVWKLGPYLEYWPENFVKRNRRPATYNLYEMIVRLYLKPGLGSRKLTSLTVPMVQEFLNQRLQKGDSIRKVQVMRTVLSAALTRAVREELIVRNVARLVELPQWQRGRIRPWAADEARAFLTAAKPDPRYTAFVLLILYGRRRGEVLGLRWDDVDFDSGTILIHQQLQRVRGELFRAPVKTQAGQRGLPLLDAAAQALKLQAERQAHTASTWAQPGRNRARVHYPHRAAGRTAQLRPILPAHLRRQQDPAHQGPPCLAHGGLPAQGPGRSRPRRADDPRPHPDQHRPGDLHGHRRASPP